ncbi:hypothetical protein [Pseudochryseolinea flava]|uniref:Uncharacterized protein n=1 Tax=Pseudochryseolinea flava TaxID=2059302 RepID=A0A364Y3J0_9BACT|nr:hypothetical protein [Pseudochryseolinea flava]RAW00579.1 hypothetical protein DQQ10_13350 [Pseudochryseolinea flava]
MRSREVTDSNSTRWSCVQAFTGTNGKAAKEAVQLTENSENKVEVICTPSGGAQTVRLRLDPQWDVSVSDEALVSAIEKQTNHISSD